MKLLFLALIIATALICSTPRGLGGTTIVSPAVIVHVVDLHRRERRRGLTRRRHRGP